MILMDDIRTLLGGNSHFSKNSLINACARRKAPRLGHGWVDGFWRSLIALPNKREVSGAPRTVKQEGLWVESRWWWL